MRSIYTKTPYHFWIWMILVLCVQTNSIAAEPLQNNCGLNCAITTLRYFGIDSTVPGISKNLHQGEGHDVDLSLGDLKELFERNNLHVAGLATKNAETLVDSIPSGSVAVIRITGMREGIMVSHFILCIATNEKKILLDPSVGTVAEYDLSNDRIKTWLGNISGEYLVVDFPDDIGPKLCVTQAIIEVNVPVSDNNVTATIPIRNGGHSNLTISSAKGSCACMSSVDFKKSIEPGEVSEITVHFLKSMLPIGEELRQIVISSNDEQKPQKIVPIKLRIRGDALAEETRIIPMKVAYGRTSLENILKTSEIVKLIIPGDGSTKLGKVSVAPLGGLLEVKFIDERIQSNSNGNLADRVLSYQINWKSNPSIGRFDQKIEFEIFMPEKKPFALEMGITGEVIDASNSLK